MSEALLHCGTVKTVPYDQIIASCLFRNLFLTFDLTNNQIGGERIHAFEDKLK